MAGPIDSPNTKNPASIFGYDDGGNLWRSIKVAGSGAVSISQEDVFDTPEFFEDTNFVVSDSPATLDINTALGRNAANVLIMNDGPGEFTFEISNDGSVYGDSITLKRREYREYKNISIDSIRITHSGTDSAYRVEAI